MGISHKADSQHLWLLLSLADCVPSRRLIVLGKALRESGGFLRLMRHVFVTVEFLMAVTTDFIISWGVTSCCSLEITSFRQNMS